MQRTLYPGTPSQGWSVAIDGNIAVVGAPFDDVGGYSSGVVKVYNATTGGLLVHPGGQALIPEWVAGIVMIGGALLNISAKVALNRSFGLAAANRGVKHKGVYQLMRHPMYAGYITTQFAFLLANPTAWNLAVYLAAWSAQLLRIQAEERVLSQDAAYRAYSASVPWRLAPGVY